MVKVLIMSKQVNVCKEILNKILSQIDGLRIVGIVTKLSEANSIMKEIEPNLIISTELNIIKLLKSNFLTYSPSIVVLSKNTQKYTDYDKLLFLSFDLSYSEMSSRIFNFIKDDIISNFKEKTIDTLIKLKFDFNLSGTIYILESVLYIHTYKGSYLFEKMNRDIYPYIAKIYGTNSNRVKWSISRSINYMYNKHSKESYKIVEDYFGTPYPIKPTPKLVISLIASKISL